MHRAYKIFISAVKIYLLVCIIVSCTQRRLLFFPSHADQSQTAAGYKLHKWIIDGEYSGYYRPAEKPKRVWLFLHGNAGQASDRGYALPCFAESDSVYILEYPGYGQRPGSPSKESFNRAARAAYNELLKRFPESGVSVIGESLGSGPAAALAKEPKPPNRIVLAVPFDRLKDVAQNKFFFLPIGVIMLDRWDNIESLRDYKGRLDIYGAKFDKVIPAQHARKLADSVKGSNYHEIPSDHNEWSDFVKLGD